MYLAHPVEHLPVLDDLECGGELFPPLIAQVVVRHNQAPQMPQDHNLALVWQPLEQSGADPLLVRATTKTKTKKHKKLSMEWHESLTRSRHPASQEIRNVAGTITAFSTSGETDTVKKNARGAHINSKPTHSGRTRVSTRVSAGYTIYLRCTRYLP